jgi:hypothetical protein
MKLNPFFHMLLLCVLGLSLGACSGSQQDEENLQAEGQQEEEWAEEDTEDNEADVEEEEFNDLVDTTPVEPAPAAAPVGNTVEANRVVRYVGTSGAAAFSETTGGSNLGVFPQGTRLLVVDEGEWCKIQDGMFVKSESLSAKPVPRAKKKAVWSHPAH